MKGIGNVLQHMAIFANLHLCICPRTILLVSSVLQGILFSLLNLLITAVLRDMTLNLVGQQPDLVWQSLF